MRLRDLLHACLAAAGVHLFDALEEAVSVRPETLVMLAMMVMLAGVGGFRAQGELAARLAQLLQIMDNTLREVRRRGVTIGQAGERMSEYIREVLGRGAAGEPVSTEEIEHLMQMNRHGGAWVVDTLGEHPDPAAAELWKKTLLEWSTLTWRLEVAQRIRYHRRAAGLSQLKLAALVGVRERQARRWEKAISGPSWKHARALAAVFDDRPARYHR